MKTYDDAFDFVVGAEGGYTDDPHDRGNWTSGHVGEGELKGTKYGISAMSFPELDIKNLTKDRAKDIYKVHYWEATSCDKVEYPKAVVMFDCSVNQGVFRAKKFAQEAVNVVVDGIIGPNTLKALQGADNVEFVTKFLKEREDHYRSLSSFSRYGKGWLNRLEHVRDEALG